MKIGLLGVTGGVGERFAILALHRGHTIIALARTSSKVKVQHPKLVIIKGDSTSLEAIGDFAASKECINGPKLCKGSLSRMRYCCRLFCNLHLTVSSSNMCALTSFQQLSMF